MKNTILGIRVSNWTVHKISIALKESKKDKNSWNAGYSLAKAEEEIENEYRYKNITKNECDIISKFLRNITIEYQEKRRESLYSNKWRKKTHIPNISK